MAIRVDDLSAARGFYGELLGCDEGRSSERWVDFDFFGHQVVCHLVDDARADIARENPVDGDAVPIPHFGAVLEVEDFQQLAARLEQNDTDFIIRPRVRFEGEPGEQWTMFFRDPAGNTLEFKAFRDLSRLFAS